MHNNMSLEARLLDDAGFANSYELIFVNGSSSSSICEFRAGEMNRSPSDLVDPFEVEKYGQFEATLYATSDQLVIDTFSAWASARIDPETRYYGHVLYLSQCQRIIYRK